MKSSRMILPAICCIPLLSSCASYESASVEAWTIRPVAGARDSGQKPEALYQLGRYYQGQNRHDLAISAYKRAIAVDAGFVEAHNGLGVIYSMQGRYDEAIGVFRIAVKLAPKASHIYSNLGYAYYAQGLNAEAIAALEQATTLDPANQRALNNLGLAYAKAGDREGSVQAFAQADNAPTISRVEAMAKTLSREAAARIIASPAIDSAPAAAASGAATSRATPQVQPSTVPSKDGGIIRQASSGTVVPVVESRVKVVLVAPNVYELREQHSGPARLAAISGNPGVSGKLDMGKFRLEVANGNGINGMAKKVSRFLHGDGYPAARLTNQKPFHVKMTQIQYRDGYQAQAQHLQSGLPGQPAMVPSNDMRADIGVRLVLGKDIAQNVAYFDGKPGKFRVAHNKNGAY
jgi:Tfp pilus assembly protein PilF